MILWIIHINAHQLFVYLQVGKLIFVYEFANDLLKF